MNSLLPTIQDALSVHDAAHREQDRGLHDVALKMLALAGQAHIKTDDLDESAEDVLSHLPGAICLCPETAAVVVGPRGSQCVATNDEAVGQGLSGKSELAVVHERYFNHRQRTPAYQTWLIRMDRAEEVVPAMPFKVGDYVAVGSVRQNGAYRFPAVAQQVSDDYMMLQIHKDGDEVRVFDKDGKQPRGMASVIDLFVGADVPRTGIFECILSDGQVRFWDVLMVNDVDLTVLPYMERQKAFMELTSDSAWAAIGEATVFQSIGSQDDLPSLAEGKWLIRYQNEILSESRIKPFWFERDAGGIKVGTVLPWVKPSGVAEDPSGMVRVIDTGLPPLQIHKKNNTVSIYVAEGGRNRDNNLPQIVQIARGVPEDFVMEAMWTCSHGQVPVSAGRVQNPKADLTDCDIKLYPYDIVVWGSEKLHGRPMYERTDLLEQIIVEMDNESVEFGVVDDGGWLFTADSVRPLDGDCSHCFKAQ